MSRYQYRDDFYKRMRNDARIRSTAIREIRALIECNEVDCETLNLTQTKMDETILLCIKEIIDEAL